MKRIKKGDKVIIISGKDKGSAGLVQSVDDERITVAGRKLVTKNVKPNPMTGETGGRIKKESSIHVSNVKLAEDGKPVKVGFRAENNKKVRYSKKSNNVI